MGYRKNVSCRLEFIDRDANTASRLEELAEKFGLYTKEASETDKVLPGYTLRTFYWSGYTLLWSNQDLQEWITAFAKEARALIGHSELFVDIHC